MVNENMHLALPGVDFTSVPNTLTTPPVNGVAVHPDGTTIYATLATTRYLAVIRPDFAGFELVELPYDNPKFVAVPETGDAIYVVHEAGELSVADLVYDPSVEMFRPDPAPPAARGFAYRQAAEAGLREVARQYTFRTKSQTRTHKPVRVRLSVGEAKTEATVYRAARSGGCALVLAHGAGAGRKHPFMVKVAQGLSARGVDVMTFDFLYMHARRRLPDRNDSLEACWRAAIAKARAELAPRRLCIGGKSMGGRIASHIAAAGEPPVDGLVLLGYPLHPPGQPQKLRAAHLGRIRVSILCLQGTRDAFGVPDDLRPHFPAAADIVPIVGGHSFAIDDALLDRIARFVGHD